MVIQDDTYSRFPKHFKALCLSVQCHLTRPRKIRITDQILYSPTRVVFCRPVDQGLYGPIPELKEQ